MTHTTETTPNAEKIAARLTDAQRRAIILLSDEFQRAANRVGWRNQAPWEYRHINAMGQIVERANFDGGHGYRLTPLGRAVREILRREA